MWTCRDVKKRRRQSGGFRGDAVMTRRNVAESASMSEPPQPPPSRAADTTGPGTRLAWLDVLRGLAALAVVFDHVSYYVLQHVRSVVYQWFDPGNSGLFLFCSISRHILPA